jgi:hypothetical protein
MVNELVSRPRGCKKCSLEVYRESIVIRQTVFVRET